MYKKSKKGKSTYEPPKPKSTPLPIQMFSKDKSLYNNALINPLNNSFSALFDSSRGMLDSGNSIADLVHNERNGIGQAPLQGKGISGMIGVNRNIPENLAQRIKDGFGLDANKLSLSESTEVGKIGAQATAQGNEIRFAPGLYKPDTKEGQKLLGHELNHVREQALGQIHANVEGTNIHFDPAHEASSDRAGEAFANNMLSGVATVDVGSYNTEMAVQGRNILGMNIAMMQSALSNSLTGNRARNTEAIVSNDNTSTSLTNNFELTTPSAFDIDTNALPTEEGEGSMRLNPIDRFNNFIDSVSADSVDNGLVEHYFTTPGHWYDTLLHDPVITGISWYRNTRGARVRKLIDDIGFHESNTNRFMRADPETTVPTPRNTWRKRAKRKESLYRQRDNFAANNTRLSNNFDRFGNLMNGLFDAGTGIQRNMNDENEDRIIPDAAVDFTVSAGSSWLSNKFGGIVGKLVAGESDVTKTARAKKKAAKTGKLISNKGALGGWAAKLAAGKAGATKGAKFGSVIPGKGTIAGAAAGFLGGMALHMLTDRLGDEYTLRERAQNGLHNFISESPIGETVAGWGHAVAESGFGEGIRDAGNTLDGWISNSKTAIGNLFGRNRRD